MPRNKIKCTLCTKRCFYVQVINRYENYIIVNPLKLVVNIRALYFNIEELCVLSRVNYGADSSNKQVTGAPW